MSTTTNATSTHDLAAQDLIDLRDLVDLRDDLRGREGCDYCHERIVPDPTDAHFVHADTGRFECQDADTHADGQDYLTDDELELLTEVARFERDEYPRGLERAAQDDPTLVNESYWRDFAEDEANEVILGGVTSDAARYYFDYDRFADDLKGDYSTVTLAGATFYTRGA